MADTVSRCGLCFVCHRRRPVRGRRWRSVVLLACLLLAQASANAETFEEHFHGPVPSWQVKAADSQVQTKTHRRSRDHGKDGVGEQLIVESKRGTPTISVVHVLPKARVLNELEVGLWVRTESPNVRVWLHVLLPEYDDPQTGRTLAVTIPGDVVEEIGDWQRITCRTDDKLVEERLQQKRAELGHKLSPRQKIVDRVILRWPLAPGENELAIDELTFGPLIRVEDEDILQSSHEQEVTENPPVQFRLDRLEFEGRPTFVRIVPYHGEPLTDLSASGFNVAWIPDYKDKALLTSLREAGLWAAATPPQAAGTDGDPGTAGLLPFGGESRAIAFWMLGTRVPPQSQPRLQKWVDQIHEADRKYDRPLAADVIGEEGAFSKELDLLGISRHMVGSSLSLTDYRDWLTARRGRARPGSFCWTWIQVVPSPPVAALWQQHQIPVQLEPEQIRLQVFAALAAGMRGLGFWTTQPLNAVTDADRETLLAMRQINGELALIEPWLATTNSIFHVPVTIGAGASSHKSGPSLTSQLRSPKKKRGQFETEVATTPAPEEVQEKVIPELTCAVLKTDRGTLLLPMWLETNAQFVPGPMAANAITMVVPGVEDTATAWEVTTTGLQNLNTQRVDGGRRVTLKNFDQASCILLTSDFELVESLKQRVAEVQERSARNLLALADLKLQRVRNVDQQLSELGLQQPQTPNYLAKARQLFVSARNAASNEDWQHTRIMSQQALQMARAVQRSHWDEAVRDLPSPVASPFTISYASLPAQARLAMQLGNASDSVKNLLPSGDFEDVSVPLTTIGWRHEQQAAEAVHAAAELAPEPHRGKYSLRLHAKPAISQTPTAAVTGREYVTVTTPPITVHAGDVCRISGWIKLPAELQDTRDGVMIYDSLAGRNGALRFRASSDWQRFELVREASASQDVEIAMSLAGFGDVHLDDLEVAIISSSGISQTSAEEPADGPRAAPDRRRWPDLRRLNPLPSRRKPNP